MKEEEEEDRNWQISRRYLYLATSTVSFCEILSFLFTVYALFIRAKKAEEKVKRVEEAVEITIQWL